MGWDAFTRNKLTKYELEEFKKAADFVISQSGSVDGFLRNGGLDVSDCGEMLKRATQTSVWNPDGWSSKRVKELNANSFWEFDYSEDDAWAFWSAKMFLETCAKLNLPINFSY